MIYKQTAKDWLKKKGWENRDISIILAFASFLDKQRGKEEKTGCKCHCHPYNQICETLRFNQAEIIKGSFGRRIDNCPKTCIHCQPTEKPIIEELDQHYWAGYHNGRMDGKYQALADYKQKLIKEINAKQKDHEIWKALHYQRTCDYCRALDEVEAVIRE